MITKAPYVMSGAVPIDGLPKRTRKGVLLLSICLTMWSPAADADGKIETYNCRETLAIRLNTDGLIEQRDAVSFRLRISSEEDVFPEGSRYQQRIYENHVVMVSDDEERVFWLSDFKAWKEHDSPYFVGYGLTGESLRLHGQHLIYMGNNVREQIIIRAVCGQEAK